MGARLEERRRDKASECYATLIVDGCTRKHLQLRLWPYAPTAEEMLLTIRDAALRYGRPDAIYCDNGSEFKNKLITKALSDADISQAFSKAYDPRGRGKGERPFRTIKSILGGLPGFYGGSRGKRWNLEDLYTVGEVESLVQQRVDLLINQQTHSTTKRKPSEHYAEAMKQRIMRGEAGNFVAPERTLALMSSAWRKRHTYGIEISGHYYIGGDLCRVIEGEQVLVFYDPIHWREIFFATSQPDGSVRYLGRAEAYDLENPAPEPAHLLKALAEIMAEDRAAHASNAERRYQGARQEYARVESSALATDLLGMRQTRITAGSETSAAVSRTMQPSTPRPRALTAGSPAQSATKHAPLTPAGSAQATKAVATAAQDDLDPFA